jgi:hypothetical protein
LGGAVMALAMISALLTVPNEFLEWRPWVYGLEAFTALIGVLLLFAPRASAKKTASTLT